MAKIRQNDFIGTVNEVISGAREAGVVHLHAEGSSLNGRKIRIGGQDHFHFGTTGYLGLEQDQRLKKAAIKAIENYGTQFPLSKSYISHPLYAELEELWLLDSSLASEESFVALQQTLTQPLWQAVIWLVLAALAYHLVAGIRHILMDVGVGESLKGGRVGAQLVIAGAVILMVLAGVWVW